VKFWQDWLSACTYHGRWRDQVQRSALALKALSFWNKREDAEEYQREQYQKIHDTVRHLLETKPEIPTFDVHTSTTHRIAASKAA
jgi:hypothetical protein